MADAITCDVTDAVAQVRLARPEKLNALTLEMLASLARVAHGLRRDRDLRAVVIAGDGESFSAGLDFGSAMRSPLRVAAAFVPHPLRATNLFQEACWAWRRLPVPVIAAVHGHCYGAGMQLALATDFRFTTPDAEWSVLEGRWGLVPDMTGIRTLSELVGVETAKRLTMTAETLSGERAHELGLAGAVGTDPHADAAELIEALTARSPDAIAAAKRLFQGSRNASARRTFARERLEQARLLAGANARAARAAAMRRELPRFGPRARR